MLESDKRQSVLKYELAAPKRVVSFVGSMRSWRSATAWFFWAAIACLFVSRLVAIIAAVGALCCSIMTLVHMGRAATFEVGRGYAARQVILAVLLMPFLLLGIFIVPPLVESDLLNWREVEERDKESGLSDGKKDPSP